MTQVALWVHMQAKEGKEADVEEFLNQGQALVEEEPDTTAWFAVRLGPSSFGIFDAFPNEDGRQAHLNGKVAAALMEKADELLAEPPKIEQIDVLADKLPG
ncbi:MAG TPA: antibiotic biosynthesis monooxygenase [Thermoleophilaceae bacterium]|jgi:quinol monooxygenase YgiN